MLSSVKTKVQISCAVIAQLISPFVLATQIVQFLFFLNPKFQAAGLILWLHRSVYVRPGQKPRLSVFSRRDLFDIFSFHQIYHIIHKNVLPVLCCYEEWSPAITL